MSKGSEVRNIICLHLNDNNEECYVPQNTMGAIIFGRNKDGKIQFGATPETYVIMPDGKHIVFLPNNSNYINYNEYGFDSELEMKDYYRNIPEENIFEWMDNKGILYYVNDIEKLKYDIKDVIGSMEKHSINHLPKIDDVDDIEEDLDEDPFRYYRVNFIDKINHKADYVFIIMLNDSFENNNGQIDFNKVYDYIENNRYNKHESKRYIMPLDFEITKIYNVSNIDVQKNPDHLLLSTNVNKRRQTRNFVDHDELILNTLKSDNENDNENTNYVIHHNTHNELSTSDRNLIDILTYDKSNPISRSLMRITHQYLDSNKVPHNKFTSFLPYHKSQNFYTYNNKNNDYDVHKAQLILSNLECKRGSKNMNEEATKREANETETLIDAVYDNLMKTVNKMRVRGINDTKIQHVKDEVETYVDFENNIVNDKAYSWYQLDENYIKGQVVIDISLMKKEDSKMAELIANAFGLKSEFTNHRSKNKKAYPYVFTIYINEDDSEKDAFKYIIENNLDSNKFIDVVKNRIDKKRAKINAKKSEKNEKKKMEESFNQRSKSKAYKMLLEAFNEDDI